MLVTESDVATIVAIGLERAPFEACGVLVTSHTLAERVREVPNHSTEPNDSCVMRNDDILDAVLGLVGDPLEYSGDLSRELVVWHTHPSGKVGPGKTDMEFRRRLGDTRCLVVTVPTGEAVQF